MARRTWVGPGEAKTFLQTAAYTMKCQVKEKKRPEKVLILPVNMPSPNRSIASV
jgi:hypothetical protein